MGLFVLSFDYLLISQKLHARIGILISQAHIKSNDNRRGLRAGTFEECSVYMYEYIERKREREDMDIYVYT